MPAKLQPTPEALGTAAWNLLKRVAKASANPDTPGLVVAPSALRTQLITAKLIERRGGHPGQGGFAHYQATAAGTAAIAAAAKEPARVSP